MLVPIANTPRPYAWGSATAIAELLGTEPSGAPEAELWLGAHPGSPSRIIDPAGADGAADLAAWLAAAPGSALAGFEAEALAQDAVTGAPRLPFLLKLLAAEAPLSIQAHPTMAQAVAGFGREQAARVPIDAPERNYKDPYHKPELIVALSERFDALSGLRPAGETRGLLDLIEGAIAAEHRPAFTAAFAGVGAAPGLAPVIGGLLAGAGTKATTVLVAAIAAAAARLLETPPAAAERWVLELETAAALAAAHPGDPGVLVALLMHRVRLQRGEALYLAAGNLHAYLHGLGIELMAGSDNVLRGGLTPKHIDVPELLAVLDAAEVPVPRLLPQQPAPGVCVFAAPVPDFRLTRLEGAQDGRFAVPLHGGPAIVVVVAGAFELRGARHAVTVTRGSAVFCTPDETAIMLRGEGDVFAATVGGR